MRVFAIAFVACVLSGASYADELPIKPGLWESTMTRTNPMTGKPTKQVSRSCVEADSFDPESVMQDAEECSLVDSKLVGNTLTFNMTCAMGEANMNVTGTYETSGDTGSGHMEMNMAMAGMKLSYETSWDAQRIGDCDG